MKRRVSFVMSVLLLLFLPVDARAICQKCMNDNTATAMCWTLDACDSGATMSACVVREFLNEPTRLWCDNMDTGPGEECNGADPSCQSGGGSGGSGGGGEGGGSCSIQMGQPCPPECSQCQISNLEP